MNPETSPNKFPTPLADGSNKASHDSSRRTPKASDGVVFKLPPRHLRLLGSEGVKWPTGVSNLLLMTLLLAAAPSQAAGVCIVCPPGHTCPAGGAPVISGTPGQILRRTETGTIWMNMYEAFFLSARPLGSTGDQMIRTVICPPPPSTTNAHVVMHGRCAGLADPSAFDSLGQGALGPQCWCQMENRDRPHCRSRWVHVTTHPNNESCVNSCLVICAYHETLWRAQARWDH